MKGDYIINTLYIYHQGLQGPAGPVGGGPGDVVGGRHGQGHAGGRAGEHDDAVAVALPAAPLPPGLSPPGAPGPGPGGRTGTARRRRPQRSPRWTRPWPSPRHGRGCRRRPTPRCPL